MAGGTTSSLFCNKCHRTISEKEFYGSNNAIKYPNGKLATCKKCITMHVDNWEPETYKWILEECDVPYVPKEWDKLLAKYALEGKDTSPTTILGRYLAKMKLKQYKDYRWKDTEFLQKLEDKRIREGMESQGFSAAEIAQAIEDNHKPAKEVAELKAMRELSNPDTSLTGLVGAESSGNNDYFAQISPVKAEDVDIAAGLTEEDKQMLYLKWGKTYTPEEWVKLEQLYNEMMQSYDIQTAGHIDSLKLLCKTSLKANQLLDLGDVDGAQKMLRMYDSLMKSGKFKNVDYEKLYLVIARG